MKKIIKKVLGRMGVSLFRGAVVPMHARQIRNVLYLDTIYKIASRVPGAIVECGVGKGRTLLVLSYLVQLEGKKRLLWGFDSFEGFPEVSEQDVSSRNPKKGDWSGTVPEYIRSLLLTAGFDKSFIDGQICLVKGFFDLSLREYTGEPIALLHVDCDLYDSYKVVLENLVPIVSPGGVVLFDEYGEGKWPGAKKAVDEFIAGTSYRLLREPISGKFYFIK